MPKKLTSGYVQAKRLQKLPPYLFAEIDQQKAALQKRGKDIINLSIGDPDLGPPAFLIKEFQKALARTDMHNYPPYAGTEEFREAIAQWYQRNDKVRINPENEIWALSGAKEGIVHLILAVVNPGDVVLIPDPGYPPYQAGTAFANGVPYYMPLRKENDFLPDLDAIPAKVANRAKLMFLNYPNNPTGCVATKSFYEDVVKFASKHGIIVCQDAAYNEIYFEERPISFLKVKGGKDVGVEACSFSKMFSITGWRLGWLAGNADVIKATGTFKTNLDSGVFVALQKACSIGLKKGQAAVKQARQIYQKRRDVLVKGLRQIGWSVNPPPATFYVWIETPLGYSSVEFSQRLLNKLYIVTTPGNGFGKYGEGFIRLALTVNEAGLVRALSRFRKLNLIW